jgi:hypothetical protein
VQLGFWQKTAVYITTATVGLSGLSWFVLHDVVTDDASDLPHMLLVVHGVSAYALLVVIGSLLPVHVRLGWLRRRNVATGLMLITVMAVLCVTALALYYGDEEWQAPAKWLHLAFGIGAFVLFPAHAVLKMKRRESTLSVAVDRSEGDAKLEHETGRESAGSYLSVVPAKAGIHNPRALLLR